MTKHLATHTRRLTIAIAVALPCAQAFGQLAALKRQAYRSALRMELKAQPAEPAWAGIADEPLFTFAWASDFHLHSGNIELIRQAMRYVDEHLAPAFLMITGDNNSIAEPSGARGETLTASERRQSFFKRFLDENLKTPTVVIPGDNWPPGFETVFGAFQFSFDYGGMHFLFTSLDSDIREGEGLGVFDPKTWQWMRDDLKRNRRRPTLVMLHENVAPPTFFDAEKLQHLFEESSNVVASLCGHMHLDLDVTHRGVRYLICPGLGVNARHGLKYVKVYRHALIIRTVEYDAEQRRFEKVNKWQLVPIPQPLQAALHRPDGNFAKANYTEIPAHPRRYDPALKSKTAELLSAAMRYMGGRFSGSNASRPAPGLGGQ